MAILKERIASSLAAGISATNVAATYGCTPAYISQLLKDPLFVEMVERKRTEELPATEDSALLEKKYESMEHRLLKSMEDALPGADLRDITGALRAINERQNRKAKRLAPPLPAAGPNITVVPIAIPAIAIPTLSFNSKNEVIAIDDRAMAPMSSQGVAEMFKAIAERKNKSENTIEMENLNDSTGKNSSVPADF